VQAIHKVLVAVKLTLVLSSFKFLLDFTSLSEEVGKLVADVLGDELVIS